MEWRESGGRTPFGKLLQFLGSKWGLEGGEVGQGSDNGMERPGVLPQSCCFGGHFMSSVWSLLSYVDPTVTVSHLLQWGVLLSSWNFPKHPAPAAGTGGELASLAGLSVDFLPQREQFLIKYCLRPPIICFTCCHLELTPGMSYDHVSPRWLGLQFSS